MFLNVKWLQGKKTLEQIEADPSEPPLVFKTQLWTLTGVPPERQKLMFKGKQIADESDWETFKLKDGATLMLMGSADALPEAPTEKVVFLEDVGGGAIVLTPPGLYNLGNTCYLNSTIQCLRTVPHLVDALKSYQSSGGMDGNAMVTSSFGSLLKLVDNSKGQQAVSTAQFLQAFRQAYPQFAEMTQGSFSQQDAEEAYSQLMTALSRTLVKLPDGCPPGPSNVVEALFGIRFNETYKCIENEEEAAETKEEVMYKLPCFINSEVNHLNDAIKNSMVGEMEKRSSSLGRDARYTKTTKIARLPPYLTVQFVRFWYNVKEQLRAKVLRKVSFPERLDLYQHCTDELKVQLDVRRNFLRQAEGLKFESDQKDLASKKRRKKNKENKDGAKDSGEASSSAKDDVEMGEASNNATTSEETKKVDADAAAGDAGGDESATNETAPPINEFVNDTGVYELCAVLTHKGRAANAGHYVGWARTEGDKWLKFDDDKVSDAKWDDVRVLDGGGDWHMAYMLVYRSKYDSI